MNPSFKKKIERVGSAALAVCASVSALSIGVLANEEEVPVAAAPEPQPVVEAPALVNQEPEPIVVSEPAPVNEAPVVVEEEPLAPVEDENAVVEEDETVAEEAVVTETVDAEVPGMTEETGFEAEEAPAAESTDEAECEAPVVEEDEVVPDNGGEEVSEVEDTASVIVPGASGEPVDAEAEPVEPDLSASGEPEQEEEVLGDVNGDGKVTSADSVLVTRYVAGWGASFDRSAADVDGNGSITGADAMIIARIVAYGG